MNVFFDNCTSPVFAATLDGFIRHLGHSAYHILECPGLPNGRDSSDLEWIEFLRRDRDVWIFVSGDGRLLKNRAERAALRSAGLHGFLLAKGYQKTPANQVAAALVWQWPQVETIVQMVSAPALYEIPIGKSRKLKSLPF